LPEFKGVFSNVDWMLLELLNGIKLLVDTQPGSDLGVLRPFNATDSKNATWSYPQRGGLFLFHKVPAVGTKFNSADQLGPQGQSSNSSSDLKGTLIFILNGDR
jgi:hypothetical protein